MVPWQVTSDVEDAEPSSGGDPQGLGALEQFAGDETVIFSKEKQLFKKLVNTQTVYGIYHHLAGP